MNTGSSDRVPASALILFASILFTAVSFTVFIVWWKIPVPRFLPAAVLGFQFTTVLLGRSKILTPLGAASLSALIAVAACIGTVVLVFPPSPVPRILAGAGGGAALFFILASFVAASSSDTVPADHGEPLELDITGGGEAGELIKYGEAPAPYAEEEYDLNLMDDQWEKDVQEWDILQDGSGMQEEGTDALEGDGSAIDGLMGETTAGVSDAGDFGQTVRTGEDEHGDFMPVSKGFSLRPRFRVLDAASGVHYGTFYDDQGHSSLDPAGLAALLDDRIPGGEIRIAKLDWSNFDEVEVHVRVEDAPVDDTRPAEGEFPAGEGAGGGWEAGDPDKSGLSSREGDIRTWPGQAGSSYVIYDRRTMQPMAEYVPEGRRARIDRLTLYRLLPEYNFKSFEIDSIRWEAGEVRILIRGEKKKGTEEPRRRAEGTREKRAQDKGLEPKPPGGMKA